MKKQDSRQYIVVNILNGDITSCHVFDVVIAETSNVKVAKGLTDMGVLMQNKLKNIQRTRTNINETKPNAMQFK